MPDSNAEPGKERLQKILARAGYGSRRTCEELIVEGRVTINSQTVSMLGTRADPTRDIIAVDGERLRLPGASYWIINKKEGDSFGDDDANLDDLVPGDNGRLFTAGRLDRASRGLVLITNDGRVANLLTHPRYKVPKVYRVYVKGNAAPDTLANIQRALYYAFRGARFEEIQPLKRSGGNSQLILTVYAGLPASLRDIFYKFGHGIKTITRERIGCIELRDLPPGEVRRLRPDEIEVLMGYAAEADAGHLHYEGKVVSPALFTRDEGAREFRRKKTGARTTSPGGQKRVSARVRSGEDRAKPASRPPAKGTKSTGGSRPTGAGGRKPSGAGGSRPTGAGGRKPSGTGGSRPTGAGGRKPSGTGGSRPTGAGGRKPSGTGGSRPTGAGGRKPSGTGGSRPTGAGGRKPSGTGGSRPTGAGGRKPSGTGGSRPTGAGGRKPSGSRPTGSGSRRPTDRGAPPKGNRRQGGGPNRK